MIVAFWGVVALPMLGVRRKGAIGVAGGVVASAVIAMTGAVADVMVARVFGTMVGSFSVPE